MYKRMARLAAPFTWRLLSAAFLGVATVACGVGLMSTSSYLLARAALHPSIADLQVAIVGVRAFGIARGLLRYLERLISHDATFRILASHASSATSKAWRHSSCEAWRPPS